MRNKISILIFVWTLIFGVWALANPPSGTVGVTKGVISTDGANNIGIATSSPATLLDVNGTTTIRKSLNMANNRIINVATPTSSFDAANKAYVDNQTAAIISSAAGIWGQGRPNTSVLTVAGVCGGTSECYKDVDASGSCTTGDIKIARSVRTATWDEAQSVCPVGWWACSANDRDINDASAGYGACGSTTRRVIDCDPNATLFDELFVIASSAWAWVTNPTDDTTNAYYGRTIPTTGTYTNDTTNRDEICAIMPVWCCSSQP